VRRRKERRDIRIMKEKNKNIYKKNEKNERMRVRVSESYPLFLRE